MAAGAYVGINGAARKATAQYVGINGAARKATAQYVGINGVARLAWAAGASSETVAFQVIATALNGMTSALNGSAVFQGGYVTGAFTNLNSDCSVSAGQWVVARPDYLAGYPYLDLSYNGTSCRFQYMSTKSGYMNTSSIVLVKSVSEFTAMCSK